MMSRHPDSRRLLPLVLRVAVMVLLVALILRKASPRNIALALGEAAVLPLAAGLAIAVVFTAVKVFRWRWLLARLGVHCTRAEALRSYLGGLAVGLTTPGRIGEIARSLYLPAEDRAFVTGAAFLDKVFDVSTIFAVGGLGCVAQGFAGFGMLMLAAAVALGSAPFLPARAAEWIVGAIPVGVVRRLFEALARPVARATPSVLVFAFVQAAGAFALTAVQFHLCLSAFVPAPLGATIFVLPLMILSNLIPITISGVGVREWASVVLFSWYAIPSAVAVNVALIIYFGNSLVPGLVGTLLSPRWKVALAAKTPRAASEAAR